MATKERIWDLIKEDPFLSKKMTYEEFQASFKTGIDDSSLEEAYNNYLKLEAEIKEEHKCKGIMDLIKEDPFLSKKMTYEEFQASFKTGIDDSNLEEAYNSYVESYGNKEENPKVYSK